MSVIGNILPGFLASGEQVIFGLADQELQAAETDASTSGVKKADLRGWLEGQVKHRLRTQIGVTVDFGWLAIKSHIDPQINVFVNAAA